MAGLDLDYILDDDQIGLFNDIPDDEGKDTTTDEGGEEETKEEVTEIDANNLFGEESESVGDEDEDSDEQGTEESSKQELGASPDNSEFFSSIAQAFAEEGILPDLDSSKIKTPEDFRNAINDAIKAELTEQQNRVKEALDNNIQPDVVRQYENILQFLDNIDDNALKAEDERGEELRKRLILQDFMNRGFSQERAVKEVKKALENGTDIEDAADALQGNKEYYKSQYANLVNQAKQRGEQQKQELNKRMDKLKSDLVDGKAKYLGDLELDKKTRQEIYDNITKPVFKDKNTGQVFTAIQKYEMENPDDFLTITGLLFTLTDGYKNLDRLTNRKVKKELQRGFRNLENKINSTSRDSAGNLRFTSGVGGEDGDVYLGKGLKLNI